MAASRRPSQSKSAQVQDPQIQLQDHGGGHLRVDLMFDGKSASQLWIVPFTLAIGAARIRMDGIGGVWTEEHSRGRGYARRLLEAAIQKMGAGDAALSMLYGISHFYHKFGYATAGPDHLVTLELADGEVPRPRGWGIRPPRKEDLPAIQRLYDQNIQFAVGAAVRAPNGPLWGRLALTGDVNDDSRLLVDPGGKVRAYAWQGKEFWYSEQIRNRVPRSMAISEVMADGPASADAALSLCLQWAAESKTSSGEPIERVVLSTPLDGLVASAARLRTAELSARFTDCGDSMARVIDLSRLFRSLAPELQRRVDGAVPSGSPFRGSSSHPGGLRLITEIGTVDLNWKRDRLEVSIPSESESRAAVPPSLEVQLPQSDLARLVFGAYPAGDLLARLPNPPAPAAVEAIQALFPVRCPHMYIPDRF